MIEDKIYELIRDLVEGKAYPFIAPQGTSPPYICFTKISGSFDDVLCGQSAKQYSFQIDCYSDNGLAVAEKLKDLVYERMKIFKPFNIDEDQHYESDTKLYRSTLELNFYQ